VEKAPHNLGLILGLSLGIGIPAVAAILFSLWCWMKVSKNPKDSFIMKKSLHDQSEDLKTLKETHQTSRGFEDETEAEFYELARRKIPSIEADQAVENVRTLWDLHDIEWPREELFNDRTVRKFPSIEVDHAVDNVSTLHDIEWPSEEIFDDRTVGFSTIEFCTVYENHLHGNNIYYLQKPSSTVEKKAHQRDFESAYIREAPTENCTPIKAESQRYGSSTDGAGTSGRNRADEFAILDEGNESSPPQLSDFSGRLQEGSLAFTLPEKKSNFTTGKSQIIAYAPPGEIGLTIIGDSKSGLVQVHRIKFSVLCVVSFKKEMC
jgi:hypothetical protein